MTNLCDDVLARLGIEEEWTVQAADAAGFVAGELGVWMAMVEKGVAGTWLRAEVRLARHVPDDDRSQAVVGELNERGLLGFWVHDPDTDTLALTAGLDLTTVLKMDAAEIAAHLVASLVASAEELAWRSVPQRDLHAAKGSTLLSRARRGGEHPSFRQQTSAVLEAGRHASPAQTSLYLTQDMMLYLAPGWHTEHQSSSTHGEDGHGFAFVVRVAEHPLFGHGLMIALSNPDLLTMPAADGQRRAWELNRWEARQPTVGVWAWSGGNLEYRTFLPNSLLVIANRDLPEPRLVSGVLRETVARARPSLTVPRSVSDSGEPILLRPVWDGDPEAEVLARRDPINDGLHAPDSYVWVDHLGRGTATTEASFDLWRSQLRPEDLNHPTVSGYSEWFEREVQHRHGKTRRH